MYVWSTCRLSQIWNIYFNFLWYIINMTFQHSKVLSSYDSCILCCSSFKLENKLCLFKTSQAWHFHFPFSLSFVVRLSYIVIFTFFLCININIHVFIYTFNASNTNLWYNSIPFSLFVFHILKILKTSWYPRSSLLCSFFSPNYSIMKHRLITRTLLVFKQYLFSVYWGGKKRKWMKNILKSNSNFYFSLQNWSY